MEGSSQVVTKGGKVVISEVEEGSHSEIDVLGDINIRKTGHENLEKYQGLKVGLEKMWNVKVTVVFE